MDASLQRIRQRQQYRDEISANTNEDDPLSAYHQFIQWTLQNYSEDDPDSGLAELLEETTSKFKSDPSYKADLRYLKIWSLYARKVNKPATIYAFLLANEIGVNYSLLYEEYANILEQHGSYAEAENVYRLGISRNPRAVARLQSSFQDFHKRRGSTSTGASSSVNSFPPVHTSLQQSDHERHRSTNFTATARYALMLAPPIPGKRPEKLRFDLSLLFTEKGEEYSVQEARARSMGLLGKKWGPPPASEFAHCTPSSSNTTQVKVKDDQRRKDRNTTTVRSKKFVGPEPTVTINTKEALADVFGMFNSPEKTTRLARIPGSKHAPLKKVELAPPVVRPPPSPSNDENMAQTTKTPSLRPFVDNDADRKENPTPTPSFKPFVDPDPPNTVPSVTSDGRRALSVKDPGPPPSDENVFRDVRKPKQSVKVKTIDDGDIGDVFSKVFTPVSAKPSQPTRKEGHKQPRSQPQEVLSPTPAGPNDGLGSLTKASSSFTPFVDAVFTRPSSHESAVIAPLSRSGNASSSVLRTPLASRPLSWSDDVDEDEADDDQVPPHASQEDTQPTEEDEGYYDAESYQAAPLRGRFGQFNVMTPITERTFEYTASTRLSVPSTPTDTFSMHDGGRVYGQQDEHDALEAAERLAAELREEGQEQSFQDSYEESNSSFEPVASLEYIEEKTGTLSLIDALTVSSKFKPPNPCNPFDPPILVTLLSLFPADEEYHYFKDREANQLEPLRKFANRARKMSGDTINTGILSLPSAVPIILGDRHFNVITKLGEGGFGTVFQAMETSAGGASDNDDDDEEDGAPMIALKVVKPRNVWEYHVLRRLHSVLPVQLRRSVILPHALYAYRDESFLILDLCPQGSLLDIVNNAGTAGVSQQGACLDELLVIFFSIELLRLIGGMHTAGFIHGDLKIDNCLLRLEDVPGGASGWSSLYQPSGKGGWDHKGVKMIDFGRTIDTRLFPAGQKFIAEWTVDERDCLEMRENRPWTFQTDYFGLAGIIYCMLFGKYIQSSSLAGSPGEYKIATPFKRYWQTDLWSRLFHLLLNPCTIRSDGHLPISEELGTLRQEMETWLQSNCNRSSNTLKGLLKKVEMAAMRGSTR